MKCAKDNRDFSLKTDVNGIKTYECPICKRTITETTATDPLTEIKARLATLESKVV